MRDSCERRYTRAKITPLQCYAKRHTLWRCEAGGGVAFSAEIRTYLIINFVARNQSAGQRQGSGEKGDEGVSLATVRRLFRR